MTKLKIISILTALVLLATGLTVFASSAEADWESQLGPRVIKDGNSPTGYTARFVFKHATADSVQFHGDMALQNWVDKTDETKYSPFEYKPGMMRGNGSYDVEMKEVADGYWMTEMPVTAGANQYWFTVNGIDRAGSDWLIDPANPYVPKYPADGLLRKDRRAFNPLYVPYDAKTMGNFAPMAARGVEVPREGIAHGTWEYVELPGDITEGTNTSPKRYAGVYLPPDYDPDGTAKYKTIYLQHGGGQDASDWMNIGSVPHMMDNLIADGKTEPAVVVSVMATMTEQSGYLGEGYANLPKIVEFVEKNYRVMTGANNRAFAGLSSGARVTAGIIAGEHVKLFKYYGVWSGGMQELIGETMGGRDPETKVPERNLGNICILAGQGNHDTERSTVTAHALSVFKKKVPYGAYMRVAGGHDFNTWNQLFAAFASDFLWEPEAFAAANGGAA